MIKLMKSTFYNEAETKQKLVEFISGAEILSMNQECATFEKKFSVKQGREYSTFVTSGSAANLVLIQALLNLGRLKKGDKIGVSALTWATNIMPIIQLGLVPVAIDCELETLNVSSKQLEPHLKSIKALFITNVLGFCDDLDEINRLCQENSVILLEDNCESLGSEYKGKLLGNYGLASTFSFYVGHHMSTIEGGMVCTNDDELNDMLIMVRAHGWDRNLPLEKQKTMRAKAGLDDFYAKYAFYDLALNARATEINGFLGNIQIEFWDEIVSKRVANFKRFQEAVKTNPDFIPLQVDQMSIPSNFSMPVVCKDEAISKKYKDKFTQAEVEIRPIIAGDMTKQPFYTKYVSGVTACPNADFVHKNGFYFGNNPDLTEEEISTLCSLLKK